jgi:hypothetical protein
MVRDIDRRFTREPIRDSDPTDRLADLALSLPLIVTTDLYRFFVTGGES